MEFKEIEQWSHAVDEASDASLIKDLPDLQMISMGGFYKEETPSGIRLWQKIDIVFGSIGGRWAYWHSWRQPSEHKLGPVKGIGPHPEFKAVADILFNGDAPHFIGMLPVPFDKISRPAWVLIDPRIIPPAMVRVPDDKPNPRYEKSKVLFDVETQDETRLP